MKLRQIAHSRTGDKGDTSNISVIAFDPTTGFWSSESPPNVSPPISWRSRRALSPATKCRTSARSTS
jgi:hypothetical protein